jgi:hypothetical protein
MPRGRGGRQTLSGSLQAVRAARKAAAHALEALRAEIASVRATLENLVAEQKSFLTDLFPSGGSRVRRPGRPGRRPGRIERGPVRRRGPTKADKFFAKLPQRLARYCEGSRGTPCWHQPRSVRSGKKIAKTASGYVKTGVGSPKKAVGKVRKGAKTRAKRRVARKPPQQKRTEVPVATTKS